MPYLTPDDGSPDVTLTLVLPKAFVHIIEGAIIELASPVLWEQYGDLIPEDCASIMQEIFDNRTVT